MERAAADATRVFVTGAGSGLGRAIALRFAATGARVAVTDLDGAAAQATLEEVEKAGGSGFAAVCDVRREEDFAAAAQRVEREWSGLDVLVNNAGVATAGTVLDAPIEQWRWVLDINLLGCVRGCRALVPQMVAQGRGHVVNIASFAGIANPPALASYNAAKAAVISLSETLRFELAPHGVAVSVACPSFFKTRLLESSRSQAPAAWGNAAPQMERIVERLMDKAPLGAEDVAEAVYQAVRRKRFLVLPHRDERQRARLKRFAPELYFRLARKATEKFLHQG
ncbi:MAG: SDR family oxidoreductase [Nevskia sp.]|nr:SDR family oxidoreductase [Nevskia sp.]